MFLRTKFICIIWSSVATSSDLTGSWGLSLFVLFEEEAYRAKFDYRSWGLSLFVLFEVKNMVIVIHWGSWGLSLFVLFEEFENVASQYGVLED